MGIEFNKKINFKKPIQFNFKRRAKAKKKPLKSTQMNFFDPFLEKNQSSRQVKKMMIGAVIAVAAANLLFYGVTAARIILVNKEIAGMQEIMAQSVYTDKVTQYNEVKRKLSALQQYDEIVGKLNQGIAETYLISSEYIDQINRALPQNSFMQGYRIQDGAVEIQGITEDRTAVAECQHNLIGLGIFEEVTVLKITQQSGTANYLFSIKCIGKGWVENS